MALSPTGLASWPSERSQVCLLPYAEPGSCDWRTAVVSATVHMDSVAVFVGYTMGFSTCLGMVSSGLVFSDTF